MNETRFWQLYRQERQKITGKKGWKKTLSGPQIVQAARAARKRLDEERDG